MKIKKIYIFIFTFIILFIAISYFQYRKIIYHYNIKVAEYVSTNNIFNDYAYVYDSYFDTYLYYPANIEEAELFLKQDEHLNASYGYTLVDPFSKYDSNLLYVPLYSKENNLKEGIALISAGIDGRINNTIQDTMFIDDITKLEFYNNIPSPTSHRQHLFDTTFNMYNYFFGKKDLLVYYRDGIGSFMKIGYKKTAKEFYEKLKNRRIIKNDKYYFTLIDKVSNVEDGIIEIRNSDVSIFCSMYKGRNYNIKANDSVTLACHWTGDFDKEDRIIYLNNCIQLN